MTNGPDADETISNTSGSVDFSYDFDYDMRSQLKQADIDKNSSPYHNAVYNYRKDGNLDSRTINSSTTNFTYAGDFMDIASGGEAFDLDWDDNGNMTTGVSQTFTYNWDNKLRSAPALSGNIKYDPSGNRVHKQSAVVGDRKYIVDIVGDLPTTLMEMTDNTILKTYVYANGQVLCQHDGDYSAVRYFYMHDQLGSIRQIINTSGSVVRYYTYEPFGEVLEEDGTLSNNIMFTGQYFDTEIDQYYLRARQYDPHISRFTARDPISGNFEEPLTLHKYLYCINDPVNKIDPTGLWTFYITGTGLASFGWSGVRQSGIVIDGEGNVGWINISGIGAGTPAASLGVSFGWTNADTIFDIQGIGSATGGSALFGGAEYIFGKQRSGEMYHGFEITIGPTISPAYGVEIHGHVTYTQVDAFDWNWRDALDRINSSLEESLFDVKTVGQGYGLLLAWGSLE
ncbi:MAG: RHS repeat-associated core domain-containing protein [Planctomycetes bacterium]|nr:RHS repeat-associated core domain-containing protein [Planctomycetota bacterium]